MYFLQLRYILFLQNYRIYLRVFTRLVGNTEKRACQVYVVYKRERLTEICSFIQPAFQNTLYLSQDDDSIRNY